METAGVGKKRKRGRRREGKPFHPPVSQVFVTNRYCESWDSSCEKS